MSIDAKSQTILTLFTQKVSNISPAPPDDVRNIELNRICKQSTKYNYSDQKWEYSDLIKFLSGNLYWPYLNDASNNPVRGYDFITLNESDSFSVYAINQCIEIYLGSNILINNPTLDITAIILAYNNSNSYIPSNSSLAVMREHFYNNLLAKSTPATVQFATNVYIRANLWLKYFQDHGNLDLTKLEDEEKKLIGEGSASNVVTDFANGQNNLFNLIYAPIVNYGQNYDSSSIQSNAIRESISKAIGRDIGSLINFQSQAFYRVFSKIDNFNNLEKNNIKTIVTKMEDAKIFKLASYAYEIGNFAKKRLANLSTIQKSAADYVDPTIDTVWLNLLSEVTLTLKRDPLFFQSIIYYFPSLTTFLLDTISMSVGYADQGKDVVNDPLAMVDSLEKAFGIGANGQQVFTLAYKLNNTALRLKDVLTKSPFRPNIAPMSPDIFHLRLGAANFYVPPITITVGSSFKAGSMMGAALRQKNSPKFNSGYKDTNISIQLFFPNYEEIWGISVDDVSNINLNDDFKINFSNGGTSETKIDKFLSSLRGLIAAFKYSPFVPVKNQYLNTVHGITAVGFSGMSISTIPNFPFSLVVNLELVNFNHKPFLPMISDFNQAIHWGKYRQYLGKAAGELNKYVNESFLLKQLDVKESNSPDPVVTNGITTTSGNIARGTVVQDSSGEMRPIEALDPNTMFTNPTTGTTGTVINQSQDILSTNIIDQWKDGSNLTLFVPAESQTKLFLPSTSSFRTDQEKLMNDLGSDAWSGLLKKIGIDIDQTASYGIPLTDAADISRTNAYSKSTRAIIKDAIDLLVAGTNSKDYSTQVYSFIIEDFIKSNTLTGPQKAWLRLYNGDITAYPETTQTYTYHNKYLSSSGFDSGGISLNAIKAGFIQMAKDPKNYLDKIKDWIKGDYVYRTGKTPDDQKIQQEVARAFSVTVYERFFQSGPIQALMEAARARSGAYQFNEWEVPMVRVDFDPSAVIVNGVTVNLGNSLVKLQIQMQDEPTFQHIGGKDSFINISMTVIGESELIKLKKIFDHISGLARLEHASGVIGFLGIKNIITALAGIKYVMPLSYNVTTKQGYPHVYDVELTLVDFDIFQQQRENLSNKQQKDFIEEFSSKRNPFLRIKQLWGAFNAYPDFPLQVKDSKGEVAGCLDPDFYFRSFQMFDKDVVNHFSTQTPIVDSHVFTSPDSSGFDIGTTAAITNDILEFIRRYNSKDTTVIDDMISYLKNSNITRDQFLSIYYSVLNSDTTEFTRSSKFNLLTDFIKFSDRAQEENPYIFEEKAPASFQVGNISPNQSDMIQSIDAALGGKYNETHYNSQKEILEKDPEVSFHPDEVDFHFQIFSIPAVDFKKEGNNPNRIPSMLQTAAGIHYGYVDKSSGRFYLTVNGENVKINPDNTQSFQKNFVTDTQTPDKNVINTFTGIEGAKPLSAYQNPHKDGEYKHWETMLVDTSYRDVSGRMIRAFPTYMLWLIDEGGYFAGAKLFDNFYGLQSIIDFSVVTSEDILGDTLIFRVSNLYSKLTRKSATDLFTTVANDGANGDLLSLTEGLSNIINNAINTSRNILSGMSNQYVVDINNIRLKPGVRVHLRVGYGSNPNSLQTVFNGIITSVEQGEIVTVTAQSDAIELGAVVNSTKKNQDSGKIDGGINTGLYMSEPRDLMVRLLSMGSSRVKEAFAHATRGTIFSENKFGIKHFGTILYQPLSDEEKKKNDGVRSAVAGAFTNIGNGNIGSAIGDAAWGGLQAVGGAAVGAVNTGIGAAGFSSNIRTNALDMMGTLWANFSAEVDLEIFKRNIYPGNGLGIAQFMGGDIDDGWSTASSLVPDEKYNDRIDGYIGRLTDLTYNRLLTDYQKPGNTEAQKAVDFMTAGNQLVKNNDGGTKLIETALGGAATAIGFGVGGPLIGSIIGGAALGGVLSGRGGDNIFRTLGIISPNEDDDLPGFDEVSFRAQTYMRTVWELFQTCARLLPNYIVAVRPFEDRSTVFYGKPHWLYTSGVVPVTTGYPGDKKAKELGIVGPQPVSVNETLSQIMSTINKDTNPLSDYAAYFQAFEPSEAFSQVSKDILTSSGIYQPTSYLNGKLLNFYSHFASNYYNISNQNTPIAKLPVSKGYVDIGPHLPIITAEDLTDKVGTNKQTATEGWIGTQMKRHKQISDLPPRYSFPYYSVTEQVQLRNSSTLSMSAGVDFTKNKNLYANFNSNFNGMDKVLELEQKFLINNFDVTKQNRGSSNADNSGTSLVNLDYPINLNSWTTSIEQSIGIQFSKIMMPLPMIGLSESNFGSGNIPQSQIDNSYSFEYGGLDQTDVSKVYGGITYKEWGAPSTPEEEQFYIAMRWPYNPVIAENKDQNYILNKFKEYYGISDELIGTADDYKNRKILVYSPITGRAVVCKPAYFMWGAPKDSYIFPDNSAATQEVEISATVSPDAAFFLGILTINDQILKANLTSDISLTNYAQIQFQMSQNALGTDVAKASSGGYLLGLLDTPQTKECFFAFVPDDTPLGVVSTSIVPISKFNLTNDQKNNPENSTDYIVGFGKYSATDAELKAVSTGKITVNALEEYGTSSGIKLIDGKDLFKFGGNPLEITDSKSFFRLVMEKDYANLSADNLDNLRKTQQDSGATRATFAPVWDPADMIGVQARGFYDEAYDPAVSVIAGTGRSLHDATEIWDTFRAEYHTSDSVKRIFFDTFGLDADNENEFPPAFNSMINGLSGSAAKKPLSQFGASFNNAQDEFAILLGTDFLNNSSQNGETNTDMAQALEYVRNNFIDAGPLNGGLIDYYNNVIVDKFKNIYDSFLGDNDVVGILQFSIDPISTGKPSSSNTNNENVKQQILDSFKTPKNLFLLMVGIFRQRLWEDPFARAWLVLKADKKPGWTGYNGWSFKPVDKIFRAFIDPNNNYAKPTNKSKFLQLLASTKGQGNDDSTYWSDTFGDFEGLVKSTIGPIISGIGDALSGLLSMFKLSMQQLGYGLSEVGNFKRQANILNKALNDSIYYSLGRPGSILRATDNPFTREYGEPVIEIREPFQRIHSITSFSHIISNQIQENISEVATSITAVSDGKYPVTVALDKGAPAERQVERTVETDILFDNITGSGFTGFLHPFLHPLETFRGVAKNLQGAPDELSARRIALAHLKESIKDIYSGELIVIGNADIRPHDLVYLSDVYERMYGIFEVEQVVHHFTPELGFITSITPNALVTVNDPARWFMTSWMHSWMHVQSIRNDARRYIDGIRGANSGLSFGGNVSVDKLGEILSGQMIGGFQFTHGSSALVKDVMANQMASMAGGAIAGYNAVNKQSDGQGGVPALAILATVTPVIGHFAWKGWQWVRDNVLDQHGCYVQYLNKNGQPMDAGLSYNQGMVVGQHHSTNLLPGILGVRVKTRTPEGNSYIRTDDLLKSLGWNEVEINDLSRQASYEASLIHAQVLDLSGIGPDKGSFEWQFRVIAKVTDIIDGDTVKVIDILSGNPFTIRFDAMNAAETNVMQGQILPNNLPATPDSLSLLDVGTSAGKAKMFTRNAIDNKLIIVRINQTRTTGSASLGKAVFESDFEAGSVLNTKDNYELDIFGSTNRATDGSSAGRVIGTIFYKTTQENKDKNSSYIRTLFRNNINNINDIPSLVKADIYDKSPFFTQFDKIYSSISETVNLEYFDITNINDTLYFISNDQKLMYSRLIFLKNLQEIYEKASEWPRVSWDEYYPDGTPVTLNWELVVNNLAKVFIDNLQKESQSVQTANEQSVKLGIVG